MNDKDNLKALLKKAMIDFIEPGNDIAVYVGDGPNNLGCMGFYTVFGFNQEGNLVSIGVWE